MMMLMMMTIKLKLFVELFPTNIARINLKIMISNNNKYENIQLICC